ncbi:MAG: DoxX family protein [Granulosicoccus sp.]|nr:DoxX family protein [Granulosicoccus sp.]
MHNTIFNGIHNVTERWLPGLLARFVFAAVLLHYYIHSAATKVGDGIAGFFQIDDGAYVQILPKAMENAGYDSTQLALFPEKMMVYFGTYGEFILPVLIVIGLFTRIAAIGMIVFIVVQSVVDIVGHHADADTIGAWFDRFSNSVILDQRAMWVFLLFYLLIYGAGKLSIDYMLSDKSAQQ